jgi:hypothetical protein
MDPKLLEDWLRMTTDAFKGAEGARKAFEALAKNPLSPESLAAWAAVWMPKRMASDEAPDFEELQRLVEQGWNAMGVVPRYRYVELLGKYEELKARLEEAEATVRNLREILAEQGREQEASEVLDSWEKLTRKALDVQSEWARTWTEGVFGRTSKKKE